MTDKINKFDAIIKYISGYDKEGKSADAIDTPLEYDMLSSYLSGTNIDGLENFEKLNKKDKKRLLNAFDDFQKSVTDTSSDENFITKITDNNIEDYIIMWTKYVYSSDNNELVTNLNNALFQYCKDNGIFDEEELKQLKPDNIDFNFVFRYNIAPVLQQKETEQKISNVIANPYDNNKLENTVHQFIEKNHPKTPQQVGIDNIDYGNGEYDKPATQKTNLCWAHAAINSLLSSEDGTRLLESNRYYDKDSGVFAIHLQEAEDNGFHDGIYIITPEELAQEGPSLSEGEGDITVYMIAIKKYFQEVKDNPSIENKLNHKHKFTYDVDTGNTGYRFLEIITGADASQYNAVSSKIRGGIGNARCHYVDFDYVYNIIENKNGCAVLTINEHSISVIGTNGDNLIVQESENHPNFSEIYYDSSNNHIIFKPTTPVNGKPAYELSKEDYQNYIEVTSYMKW